MKSPLALASLFAALTFSAAGATQAEEPTGYAGLSIGMVSVPQADDFDFFAGSDTSLITGNVYLGGRLNEFIGVEAGYLKSSDGDLKDSAGVDLGDYDVNTLHGALVGWFPTEGGVTPFAKIGLHRWKLHRIVQGSGRSFDGTDLMLGAGIDWTMGESWGLRVEYLYLPYDTDVFEDDKMHAFLLGAHRRF